MVFRTSSMVSPRPSIIPVLAINPDFEKLADAYGLGYAKPASLDQISGAVSKALTARGPTIIHLGPDLAG